MNITLRPPTIADAAELYAVIDANREHLRNLVWVESATLLSTAGFLATIPHSEFLRLILVDGAIAGVITLRDKGYPRGEIGYWLAEEHRHHGVMTYAVKEMLTIVQEGWYVEACIRATNIASRHVLEACGFVAEFVDYDGKEMWDIFIYERKNDASVGE